MVTWLFCVLQLAAMPWGSQCACAFWNGMGRETQLAILRLCGSSPTLEDIAVFRDPNNWQGYTEGGPPSFSTRILVCSSLTNGLVLWSKTVVDYLNQVPGSAGDWELLERYPTKMYSSGQQHEVWIISRNRVVCAAGGGGGSSSGATGSGSAAAAAGESACAVVDQDPGSAPAEPSVTPASAPSRKLAGPPPPHPRQLLILLFVDCGWNPSTDQFACQGGGGGA